MSTDPTAIFGVFIPLETIKKHTTVTRYDTFTGEPYQQKSEDSSATAFTGTKIVYDDFSDADECMDTEYDLCDLVYDEGSTHKFGLAISSHYENQDEAVLVDVAQSVADTTEELEQILIAYYGEKNAELLLTKAEVKLFIHYS